MDGDLRVILCLVLPVLSPAVTSGVCAVQGRVQAISCCHGLLQLLPAAGRGVSLLFLAPTLVWLLRAWGTEAGIGISLSPALPGAAPALGRGLGLAAVLVLLLCSTPGMQGSIGRGQAQPAGVWGQAQGPSLPLGTLCAPSGLPLIPHFLLRAVPCVSSRSWALCDAVRLCPLDRAGLRGTQQLPTVTVG